MTSRTGQHIIELSKSATLTPAMKKPSHSSPSLAVRLFFSPHGWSIWLCTQYWALVPTTGAGYSWLFIVGVCWEWMGPNKITQLQTENQMGFRMGAIHVPNFLAGNKLTKTFPYVDDGGDDDDDDDDDDSLETNLCVSRLWIITLGSWIVCGLLNRALSSGWWTKTCGAVKDSVLYGTQPRLYHLLIRSSRSDRKLWHCTARDHYYYSKRYPEVCWLISVSLFWGNF